MARLVGYDLPLEILWCPCTVIIMMDTVDQTMDLPVKNVQSSLTFASNPTAIKVQCMQHSERCQRDFTPKMISCDYDRYNDSFH